METHKQSGHEYRLDFIYDGVPVKSSTSVPSEPQEVTFSSTSIEVMSFTPPAMIRAPKDGIEITWKND